MTTVIGSIREYFLLSDARATAKIVPEGTRAELHRQLALGRQRSEAADALWSNGHVAEGLRLAADAFEATLSALEPFGEVVAPARPAPRIEPSEIDAEASAPDEAAGDEASASTATELDPSPDEADADAEEPEAAESEATAAEADDHEAAEATESEADAAAQTAEATEAADPETPEPPEAEVDELEAAAREAAEPAVAPSRAREERAPDTSIANEPPWAALVRRRGLSEGKTREVLEAHRQLAAKSLPRLDEDVSAAEGELFQLVLGARRHIDRVLAPASMTAGQLGWTRVSRISFASVIGLAVVFGLYLMLRPPTGVEATASGQWSAEFTPERAVDGDSATEWLLPDRQQGWVDLRIMPPTDITTLRLRNSHNRHYNDRATREYTIEVYSGDQLARTIEGEFTQLSPRPDWTDHALGVDDVDRIRVTVRSWHRNGGGLAEIDWD